MQFISCWACDGSKTQPQSPFCSCYTAAGKQGPQQQRQRSQYVFGRTIRLAVKAVSVSLVPVQGTRPAATHRSTAGTLGKHHVSMLHEHHRTAASTPATAGSGNCKPQCCIATLLPGSRGCRHAMQCTQATHCRRWPPSTTLWSCWPLSLQT